MGISPVNIPIIAHCIPVIEKKGCGCKKKPFLRDQKNIFFP